MRRFTVRAILAFIAVSVFWVLVFKWINPPTTILQLYTGVEHKGYWLDYEELSAEMRLAVVASEDQRFFKHWGFDTDAIAAAMEYNRTHERKRGASTISQQTAKNVFLWPSRTWLRKGLEVWFTCLIEVFWSKERILEVYLNVIEMGPQTYGADGAAQHYFKTSGEKLTRRQAALIAAALPSPRKSNPGKPSAYLTKRGQHIEKQMRLLGGTSFLGKD